MTTRNSDMTMKYRMIFRPVVALALAVGVSACGEGLTDLNVNPNEPVNVGPEYLLPNALEAAASRAHGATLNMDITGLWIQHYAEHLYSSEDRYEITDAAVAGHWNNFYAGPLQDLQEVVQQGQDLERPNVVAVGTIAKSWIFQIVTDLWGDIPYSQALRGRDPAGGLTVEYDAQQQVYEGIIGDLTAAVAMIQATGPTITTGDLFYGGNMDRWRKFANSLRLRAAMRLSAADATKARAEAMAAVAAGVFAANADNARIQYVDNGVDVHPIFGYERSRDDHSISATLVDTLKSLSDPRLPLYARLNAQGEYKGVRNGSLNSPPLAQVSRIGTYFASANSQAVVMAYSEVLFLQAEAAERGWISGSSATLYQQGITAAMSQIGIAQAAITAYLAQPAVQYKGGQAGLQQIWLQKWIALYGNGPEAYAEWRRTGTPNLVAGPDALNDGRIPVRLFYPQIEHRLNKTAVEAATARQTGDSFNHKVWWNR
jgi:hypothetical protein